jgi:hypothetical protein
MHPDVQRVREDYATHRSMMKKTKATKHPIPKNAKGKRISSSRRIRRWGPSFFLDRQGIRPLAVLLLQTLYRPVSCARKILAAHHLNRAFNLI